MEITGRKMRMHEDLHAGFMDVSFDASGFNCKVTILTGWYFSLRENWACGSRLNYCVCGNGTTAIGPFGLPLAPEGFGSWWGVGACDVEGIGGKEATGGSK